MKTTFLVNKERYTVDVSPDMPLLWVLRDVLGLTGTKFGCGKGHCWGCTVLLAGKARPSCTLKAEAAAGKEILTIEGIPWDHPVKQAWVEAQVPQCGWCQPGQIMQAVALLRETPDPDDAAISGAMRKNLCRCATYPRIRSAVKHAAHESLPENPQEAETAAADAGDAVLLTETERTLQAANLRIGELEETVAQLERNLAAARTTEAEAAKWTLYGVIVQILGETLVIEPFGAEVPAAGDALRVMRSLGEGRVIHLADGIIREAGANRAVGKLSSDASGAEVYGAPRVDDLIYINN